MNICYLPINWGVMCYTIGGALSGSVVKKPLCSAGFRRLRGLTSGWEDPLEEAHGPLQYSC